MNYGLTIVENNSNEIKYPKRRKVMGRFDVLIIGGGVVGSAVNSAINAAAEPVAAPQPTNDMDAFKSKVEKLLVMKAAGLISEEEFAAAKAELLKSIL